jgi:8-oxo-dGTP pyrophosphatase MutT (NUDIX family)
MNFTEFKSLTSTLSQKPLGGISSQFKLAPKIRKPLESAIIENKNPKKAAVLALFYPTINNHTNLLLTKRASYHGTHSSQISFPGGKFDQNDVALKNTAIRETFEEVGVSQNSIQVFKEMTQVFIPPSNFIVTPFLGFSNQTPNFIKNHEVDEIIEISLTQFLNETPISSTILTTSYAKEIEVPCFKLNNFIVWGATAMMLSEIKDLFNKI